MWLRLAEGLYFWEQRTGKLFEKALVKMLLRLQQWCNHLSELRSYVNSRDIHGLSCNQRVFPQVPGEEGKDLQGHYLL
jgi:hypothetical protein